MSPTRWVAAALFASLALAPALIGHGGGFPKAPPAPPGPLGPKGGAPPGGGGGYAGPGDVHKAPKNGPATRGPSGPATPAPVPIGPITPGSRGPATPAMGPSGLAAHPVTALPGGLFDAAEWGVWWELNRHEFLRVKEAVWDRGVVTGGDDFFLGHGTTAEPLASLRPTDEDLAGRVLPAILRVLETESQPDVLSASLMALAKIGALPGLRGGLAAARAIPRFLRHPNQEVAETAALCLGLLGRPELLPGLGAIALDEERGRELVGRSSVPARTRAFAAYGLGLFAQRTAKADLRRYAVHQLVRVLDEDETGSVDLAVACVNALSLCELPEAQVGARDAAQLPPSSSRQALVHELMRRFADRRAETRMRAHLPRAMVRGVDPLGDVLKGEVAEVLLRELEKGKRGDREVLYGCVQALGLLGTAGDGSIDARIRAALFKISSRGDLIARNLALVALAETGGRPHSAALDPTAGVSEVRGRLLEVMARGKSRSRPWAALALGVQGFRLRDHNLALSADVNQALRESLRGCRASHDAGAYALALGLRADPEAGSLLQEKLADFSEDTARGHLALSLGLMGESGAGEMLQDLLANAVYRPELMRPVATGLALLREKSLVPTLVERMNASSSSSVKAVYAWSLAYVGDARALDPTVALLEDAALPARTRDFAALALGWIGERDRMPWHARLSAHVNHVAAPETLFSAQAGGLLNIR